MKGKKEIAILFFIMAVLVFYIKSEKGDKTTYKLPDLNKIEKSDVSSIRIRNKGSETMLLRADNKWSITPEKYPADPSAVDKMLEHISSLSLTALASESKSYSIYELDEENKIEVQALSGDKVVRAMNIGKLASSRRHTFVMLDNDYRVYHADGNIRSDFSKSVSELRDKKVMAVQDDIIELTLQSGEKSITIVKAVSPVSVNVNEEKTDEDVQPAHEGPKWTTSDGRSVKDAEIDGIIRSLSDYRCDEFIEGKNKSDFSSPVYTATFKGVKEYSISFYEKKDEKYPAVSSESQYPFLVSEWKAKKIMKDLDTLVDAGQQ